MATRDVEGHPEKDGSSSQVAKHSPNSSSRRHIYHIGRRDFGTSVGSGRLVEETVPPDGTPCVQRKEISPRPKPTMSKASPKLQKAFDTLGNYTEISVVQQHAAPDVHQSSCGTGSSNVGMLEVMQSHISKNLEDESEAAT